MALPSPPVFPECVSSAAQARKMGLKVGDTIQYLHKCEKYDLYEWHELRKTLIRIDQFYTEWITSERDDRQGPWSDPYRTENGGLRCRIWERVETPPEHTAFMDLADDHQVAERNPHRPAYAHQVPCSHPTPTQP